MDGVFVGSDENSWFGKSIRKPFPHFLVLHGTGASMHNANLDSQRLAPLIINRRLVVSAEGSYLPGLRTG
jgi:hypothetical protein